MVKKSKKPPTKVKALPEKKKRSKQAIGRQARAFGHTFERDIVHVFKDRFKEKAWAEFVRRSDQSHKAVRSDVCGVPGFWLELQAAARTTPELKLSQAVRDIGPYVKQGVEVIPAAVTREKGKELSATRVTMRMGDLSFLFLEAGRRAHHLDAAALAALPVSFSLDTFVRLLEEADVWSNEDWAPFALDTNGAEKIEPGVYREPPITTNAIREQLASATKPRRAPRKE